MSTPDTHTGVERLPLDEIAEDLRSSIEWLEVAESDKEAADHLADIATLAGEQFKAHMPPEPPDGPSEGAWILSLLDGGTCLMSTMDDVREWPGAFERGACHTNAEKLAEENPGFRVVIGIASDSVLGRVYCAHAWVIDQNGGT